MQKIISVLLILTLLLSVSLTAFAEEAETNEPETDAAEPIAEQDVIARSAALVSGDVAIPQKGADDLADTGATLDLAETGGLDLNALKQKFPEGAYWNHQLKSGSGSKWDTDANNNPDGYSWTPCYSHDVDTPIGKYKCNEFGWCIQCAGFAAKISYDAFGSCYYDWDDYDVSNCKAGDVITYTHVSYYSGAVTSHTFMVIGRNGYDLTIGECNFDCHCQITWSRHSDLRNYIGDSSVTCWKAPKELTSFELETPVPGKITNSADGMTFAWKSVKNAAKYRVYYKGGTQKSWKALGDTTSTSYLFKNAEYGTQYTFTVRALNRSGAVASGFNSAGSTATYQFATTAKATAVGGKITVTWDKIAKAAKYRVYVKGGTYTKYTKLTDTANTSYYFTAGQPNVSYRFSIRCINDKNQFNSDSSSPVAATFILATPKISAVQNAVSGAKITWYAVTGAAKYRVFYRGATGWKKIADTASTSYIHTAAVSGTQYTYTVRCISSDGKSFTSGFDSTGRNNLFIAAPAAPTLKNTSKGVQIAFTSVTGAEKYRIFRKTSGTGWGRIADTTATSYVDTTAKNGVTYIYTVRCISADGTTYVSGYNSTGTTIKCTG